MTKFKKLLIIILFIVTSCSSEESTSSKQLNLKLDNRECYLIDSLSNDSLVVSYCKTSNKQQELIREGKYLNSETAVGLHVFYEKGKKNKIIQYIPQGKDSSYLNNVYAFYPNGDTNYTNSNFCLVNLSKSKNDSINVNVSLVAPYWKDSEYEMYVIPPYQEENALIRRSKNMNCHIQIPFTLESIEIIVREFIVEDSKTKERYYYFMEKL